MWNLDSLAKALSKIHESQDLHKFCKENFTSLGRGLYRCAYKATLEDGRTVAIKVGSERCNRAEVRLYKKTSSPILAAIIAYDLEDQIKWLVMEYIPVLLVDMKDDEYRDFIKNEVYKNLRNFAGRHQIYDLHKKNMGIRPDGTAVIIDYADYDLLEPQ